MISILYCDTDPAMLTAIKTSLEPYGCAVDIIDQPPEILARLESKRYAAFLCGAWLGNVDGYALCGALRNSAHANLRDLAMLVLSPQPPGFAEFQFLPAKKIHYLIKYKNPDRLWEKITAILPKGAA